MQTSHPNLPMQTLIKHVLNARHGRRDFLEHPSVAQIHARLPADLIEWFEKVVILKRDPLTIHCSPIIKSDESYFEIWRYMRDRDCPDDDADELETSPEGDDNEGSDGGFCTQPKNSP